MNNCPNCGACIEHKYNHNCPYCGTLLDFRVPIKDEINPRYMQNVELKYIERIPEADGFMFVFVGDYIKWQEAIEYGNVDNFNTTIILSAEDIKPKKVCYGIRFSYRQIVNLRMNDFRPLYEILPFGIEKEKFIEAIYKYDWRRW